MKKIIWVTLMMVFMFLLSSCGNNNSLIGSKWTITAEGITLTRQFNEDGTISEWINNIQRVDGTYTITDNEILATFTSLTNLESGETIDFVTVNWRWSYSVNGNKLTLIDLNLDDNAKLIFTRE